MGNRKIHRIVILLFVYASQGFTGENKSFFYYYNPDVVIQSAYIGEGPSIEYSFPDFATFSHLRLNIEMDSLYAVHLGIGLYDLDAGISINPCRHNDISLRFRFDIGSGIKSLIFAQLLSTISLKKTNNNEYGLNICLSFNTGVPEFHNKGLIEDLHNIIEEYAENIIIGSYIKAEGYTLFTINKISIGFSIGFSYPIDGFIYSGPQYSSLKFQTGFLVKYEF